LIDKALRILFGFFRNDHFGKACLGLRFALCINPVFGFDSNEKLLLRAATSRLRPTTTYTALFG
jgi:hypothetical protein